MNRKFGIELEIVGINQEAARKAMQAVNIKVQQEGYNHNTRKHWKIIPDGSVHNGFEIVSPILKGEAGLEEAEIVARALEDAGAYANRTCGFHVHFDARDMSLPHVKAIMRRYARHETEIDAFMPPSRRGNSNQYCHSLQGIMGQSFEAATSTEALAATQPSRYYKVNLKSYQRHDTIEFRQHSGTVNAVKICNWIRFLSDFIDQCKRMLEGEATAPQTATAGLSRMNSQLVEMLANGIAISLKAICQRFEWLPHTGRSAIARLRKLGFQIKASKVNGQAGYRLIGQSAETCHVDGLWAGIAVKVALFYQRRAAVLALAA